MILDHIPAIANEVRAKKDKATELFRAGKVSEAEPLAQEALMEATHPVDRLALTSNLASYARARGDNRSALSIHLAATLCDDDFQLGNHYCGLGNTQERLGDTDRALINYEAACYHYEQARRFDCLANTRHNIIFLLIGIGRIDEALERLVSIRESVTDPARRAEVDDTLANAYLKLGRLDEAMESIQKSISVLWPLRETEWLAFENSDKTYRMIVEARLANRNTG